MTQRGVHAQPTPSEASVPLSMTLRSRSSETQVRLFWNDRMLSCTPRECSTSLHDSRQSEAPAWESRTLCTHQRISILHSYNSSPPYPHTRKPVPQRHKQADTHTHKHTRTHTEFQRWRRGYMKMRQDWIYENEARLCFWRTPRERRAQVEGEASSSGLSLGGL